MRVAVTADVFTDNFPLLLRLFPPKCIHLFLQTRNSFVIGSMSQPRYVVQNTGPYSLCTRTCAAVLVPPLLLRVVGIRDTCPLQYGARTWFNADMTTAPLLTFASPLFRQVEIYSTKSNQVRRLMSLQEPEYMASVQSRNAFHPTQDVVVCCNASGRAHVFRK